MIFLINSKVSSLIKKNSELINTQIEMNNDTYKFLDHKSYINCSQVIKKFTIQEIKSQILADTSCIKGELFDIERKKIVDIVNNHNKTISEFDKDLILKALKD